ncbi:uncharacterized protein LOC131234584 [Magnolia sinica]|uniref:uncharacterized protein LOC131234584 n=1 Tax=Magnolia sinica TaxID=86752 RepID=UPI002659492D|nr:uncharacterized protein LOC131234584 [Magnolia sinica]
MYWMVVTYLTILVPAYRVGLGELRSSKCGLISYDVIVNLLTFIAIQDLKAKLLDQMSPSLPPITDGINRLQIIKNNDLEELRELGSGTFGTVYHGKWRGTDVAIKRINDRCFAGKPSEQDLVQLFC